MLRPAIVMVGQQRMRQGIKDGVYIGFKSKPGHINNKFSIFCLSDKLYTRIAVIKPPTYHRRMRLQVDGFLEFSLRRGKIRVAEIDLSCCGAPHQDLGF